ncbi:MAG TPA: hypothetical protein VHW66_04475 [Stellaceae bacterium]|jgi:hypothetical protein|nr:hypothetical protein [Stellaceae bacterium]
MVRQERLEAARERIDEPIRLDDGAVAMRVGSEAECLEQILEAFRDIAERDDIHQAADRLTRVQDWIRRAAEMAAADPIFAGLRLAS